MTTTCKNIGIWIVIVICFQNFLFWRSLSTTAWLKLCLINNVLWFFAFNFSSEMIFESTTTQRSINPCSCPLLWFAFNFLVQLTIFEYNCITSSNHRLGDSCDLLSKFFDSTIFEYNINHKKTNERGLWFAFKSDDLWFNVIDNPYFTINLYPGVVICFQNVLTIFDYNDDK